MTFISDSELFEPKKPQNSSLKKGPTILDNIKSSAIKRSGVFGENVSEMGAGKINPAEFGVRQVGQAVGLAGDIFGSVLSPLLKKPLEKALSTTVGQDLIHAMTLGKTVYDKIKNSSPTAMRISKDIEGVVNIASIFPVAKSGQIGAKIVKNTALKTAEVAGATAKTITKTAERGVLKAKTAGNDVLTKVANSEIVSPIEDGVKRELRSSTKPELNKYLTSAIGKDGKIDYHLPSAFDVVGEVASESVKKMKSLLGVYGKHTGNVPVLQAGIDMKNTVSTAVGDFKSMLKERAGMVVNSSGKVVPLPGRLGKLTAEESKLVSFVNDKLQKLSKDPNLQAVDDFINAAQKEVNDKTINLLIAKNSNAEAIVKKVVASVNNKIKTVSSSSKRSTYTNAKYSEIIEAYNQLNKLLGANGKNGGAVVKRIFSPHDAGTKKLFNTIKELTGVDLIKEGTLAKWAMEKIGDTRGASLLQQIDSLRGGGVTGIIEKTGKLLLEKSKDPLRSAEKYLKK